MKRIPMPIVEVLPIITKFDKPDWVFDKKILKTMGIRSWFSLKGYWNKLSPRKFKLARDYKLRISFLKSTLFVPKGFIFDGASIPFFLQPLMSPTGILFIAALFHDYAYKHNRLLVEIITKRSNNVYKKRVIPYMENAGKMKFDNLFRKIAIHTNGLNLQCNTAWLGLTIGGFKAWYKHRRNNDD